MKKMILFVAAWCCLSMHAQKKWTLDECINYAMENNLTLKSSKLKQQSAQEEVMLSKAALLPTLSANTKQGVGYSPWDNTGADKVYYDGSYGVNAQWTVWNGNQNTNTVKKNKLAADKSELATDETANSLQEQITKLYIQILYLSEAIDVNRQSLETSKKNEERGQQMLEVGKMSKADLAQLTSQRIASEYSVVESETQLAKYKLQLKQALDLEAGTEFDVAIPITTDQQALADIPSLYSVYEAAMAHRPEIKSALLDIESSNLQMKIAKAGSLPTVTINGGVGTSTNSLSSLAWGTQMKNNVDLTASVAVTVPIFDGRKTKTAVNKARIAQEQAQVDYDTEQHDLYCTIEELWLDAINNQQKFRSASASVESEQESYNLLSEQFNLGLKNIVELMTGKDKLLTAQQNKLQSKYTTILSQQLLIFYQNGTIKI
jgi:outer membrane protein